MAGALDARLALESLAKPGSTRRRTCTLRGRGKRSDWPSRSARGHSRTRPGLSIGREQFQGPREPRRYVYHFEASRRRSRSGPDSRPPFLRGHRVTRQVRVIEVREIEKSTIPGAGSVAEGHVTTSSRRGVINASGAHPNPEHLGKRRQEVASPLCRIKCHRYVASRPRRAGVRRSDPRDPTSARGAAGRELQHSMDSTQSDRGVPVACPLLHATPARTRHGIPSTPWKEGVALGGLLPALRPVLGRSGS